MNVKAVETRRGENSVSRVSGCSLNTALILKKPTFLYIGRGENSEFSFDGFLFIECCINFDQTNTYIHIQRRIASM